MAEELMLGRAGSREIVGVVDATEHSTVRLFSRATTPLPDCLRLRALARRTIPAHGATLEWPTPPRLRAAGRRRRRERRSTSPWAIRAGQRHGPMPRESGMP